MKLCAIYNVWDDWNLFQLSVRNIKPLVDGIILISSTISNYGEESLMPAPIERMKAYVDLFILNPSLNTRPDENERMKRNTGLQKAKELGYTHFLMMDADEFYEPEPFLKEKQRFLNNPNLQGLVCASQVYFKSPKLTIGLDTTRVTFIHKITPTLKFDFNRTFPFAFEGRDIRIDPTRTLNINSGVEWSPIIMHHYSYIRRDLEKKIRNSTARHNLERSTIREDFRTAKLGSYCKFYGKTLTSALVDFNIPEFDVHEDIQPDRKPLEASDL